MVKKVIIVSRHFPPMNTMAAKRYGYMCKYMHEYGWEPYVIASYARNGGYLESKTDLDIPVGRDHIQRIGMMGIVYPIDNLLYSLLFENVNRYGSLRVFERSSWGWLEKVKKDLKEIDIEGVKLVLGTYPSVENLLVARYISRKYGIPYVVDIRDLMSDYKEGVSQGVKARFFETMTERIIISSSKGVVCTTNGGDIKKSPWRLSIMGGTIQLGIHMIIVIRMRMNIYITLEAFMTIGWKVLNVYYRPFH